MPVEPCAAHELLFIQLNAGDIFKIQNRTVFPDFQNDIFELFDGFQTGRSVDCDADFLTRRRRRRACLSACYLSILLLNCRNDILGIELVLQHFIRIAPDTHGILIAIQCHGANSLNSAQGINQGTCHIIADVISAHGVAFIIKSDRHERIFHGFESLNTLLLNDIRQL